MPKKTFGQYFASFLNFSAGAKQSVVKVGNFFDKSEVGIQTGIIFAVLGFIILNFVNFFFDFKLSFIFSLYWLLPFLGASFLLGFAVGFRWFDVWYEITGLFFGYFVPAKTFDNSGIEQKNKKIMDEYKASQEKIGK